MPIQKITKEEIIIKCTEVFRINGYHHTSMNDLAQACGLKKGSFYHHFKSKEEIMQAALELARGYYNNKVFSIAYENNLSAKDRLLKLFKKQEPIIMNDTVGCLFGNITLESIRNKMEFQHNLQNFFTDWIKAFQHIFEEVHPSDKAARVAKQCVMEIEGALMMVRLYEDKSFLEDTCNRVLDRLTKA